MKNKLYVPTGKWLLAWTVGIIAWVIVWLALLFLADASGALSIYVGLIVGLNAGAFVAAGAAKPIEEEDEGFFLSPN